MTVFLSISLKFEVAQLQLRNSWITVTEEEAAAARQIFCVDAHTR